MLISLLIAMVGVGEVVDDPASYPRWEPLGCDEDADMSDCNMLRIRDPNEPIILTFFGNDGEKRVTLNLKTGEVEVVGEVGEAAKVFWEAVRRMGGQSPECPNENDARQPDQQ